MSVSSTIPVPWYHTAEPRAGPGWAGSPGCSWASCRAAGMQGCRAALFCSTHICCQQLLTVINAGNADFSLAHIEEVVGVGGDKEEICRYVGHL